MGSINILDLLEVQNLLRFTRMKSMLVIAFIFSSIMLKASYFILSDYLNIVVLQMTFQGKSELFHLCDIE